MKYKVVGGLIVQLLEGEGCDGGGETQVHAGRGAPDRPDHHALDYDPCAVRKTEN